MKGKERCRKEDVGKEKKVTKGKVKGCPSSTVRESLICSAMKFGDFCVWAGISEEGG